MHLRRFLCVFAVVLATAAARAQSATSTALAISAAGGSVRQGTAVTLTATVSLASGGAVTPGQVKFCEVGPQPLQCTDIRLLVTAQLSSAGTASYKFFPGPGAHVYQAEFLGTHAEAASASAQQTLVVSPFYPTTTTLTPSFGPNGTYTLTATVTGTGGTVPPTGTVTFEDTSNGNYVLGTATLTPATGPGTAGLTFPISAVIPTGQYCLSAAVADINGDGKPDLILGIEGYDSYGPPPGDTSDPFAGYANTVEVFLGNGDGTFTREASIPLTLGITSIGVGDLNGDGKPDLLVFESLGAFGYSGPPPPDNLNLHPLNTVQVLLGNGDGTFSVGQAIANPNAYQLYPLLPPVTGASFAAPTVGIGDFNGDGIADFAVATGGQGTVAIYFGSGDGTFKAGPVTNTGINAYGIAVGDFNRDGKADLAVTEPVTSGNTSVTILLGNGDGTFTAAPPLTGVGAVSSAIVAADFNGDGILDLGIETMAGQVNVFLGKGDGTFTQTAQSPFLGTAAYGSVLAVGDFNGDGKADLVTGSPNGADLAVLLGNGDGSFQPATNEVASGGNIYGVATYGISGVALGDFVGGGLSNVAAADDSNGQAYVVLTQAIPPSATTTSTTTLAGVSIVGSGEHQVIAVYSGDSNYQGSTSLPVYLDASQFPTTVTLTLSPTSTSYGQPVTMTATLSPLTAQEHTPTGTMTFGISGNATLGTEQLVNGVATYTATLLPVGTDSLTAIYSGDPYFATSGGSAIEVVSGYPSLSVVTSAPNPSYVGQPVTITATVSGVGSTAIASGAVTFYDNATVIGQGTLGATGHASMTTSALALGVHTLSFVYAGSAGYYGSTSASVTQVVNLQGSAVTLTASPNPAGAGQAVTLTAGVTLSVTGTASGALTFYDGASVLGQTTLDATGHATFTTSTLAVGTHNLTAVYAGVGGYAGSTSPVVVEVIENSGFTVTLSSPSITLETYQHTTTMVTLTSLGNFADSITLACGNPPQYVTCIFKPIPAALAGNGTATVSFYLDTDSIVGGDGVNGPVGSLRRGSSGMELALGVLPLGLLAIAGRRRARAWLVLAAVSIALAAGGCGGSEITPVGSTPPGTYSIPITATGAASGLTHTVQLTLTVTP